MRIPLRSLVALLCLLASFASGPVARADDASGRTCTPDQVDRVTMEARGELMAICCWKNTLLNHSSPRADQLSAEVRRLAEQCWTKQEILDEFVRVHGEAILARPQTSGLGLWFYLGPAILLLLTGIWLAIRVVPRLTHASATDAPTPTPPRPRPSDELDGLFEAELRERDA